MLAMLICYSWLSNRTGILVIRFSAPDENCETAPKVEVA
jgi:hypothetical protein